MTTSDAIVPPPKGVLTTGATTWPAGFCRAIPSLCLLLGLFILLLSNTGRLLGDPDSQWHIAVGRWIWEHRHVPSVDVWSHTFEGRPWIAKEWLSQLIFFGLFTIGGWWGVVMMTATSVGVAFVGLQEWLLRRLRPSVAIAATLAAVLLYSVHFVARPHVLVLPIVVAWMAAITSAADKGRAPHPALAVLMVLWANMHGSFPLGLVLAAVLAAEALWLADADRRWQTLGRWAVFLGLAGVATFVTPYGLQAILVPLKIGGVETLPYIDEWKPLSLDIQGGAALVLFAVVVLALLRNPRVELFRLLAVVLLGYMMVRHVRFISLFGIVSVMLVVRVAASRWSAAATTRWQPRAFLVGALVAPVFFVAYDAATMRPAPAPNVYPSAALDAALARPIAGNVYNDYNFGGFLIARGIKTFIDGRTDQLFLGDFMPSLESALDAGGDDAFARLLARHHVTWALVRAVSRDANHLSRLPGWSRIYQDGTAAVFVVRR